MRYLIFGAGIQSRAIVHYLLRHEDTTQVIVLDANSNAARTLAKGFKDDRVSSMCHNVFHDSESGTRQFVMLSDVVVSALPYNLNYNLCQLVAQVGGKHFVDLGGNNDIERMQIAFSDQAARSDMAIAPAQGIAPGAVSVLTAYLMKRLGGDRFDSVKILVGGLPYRPIRPIGYSLVFSVHGLFNEYLELTEVLKYGNRRLLESVTDIEKVHFPEPFGELEAALTSGGSSTLTQTYEGLVDDLEYRTLRWPGHWEVIKMLRSLGFLSMRPEDGLQGVLPRMMTEHVFERNLPRQKDDAIVLRVTVKKDERTARFEMTVLSDHEAGLSAMQRTTGFSAAIVARMLARGVITKRGTLTTELDVPAEEFLNEWQGCGFSWNVRET